MGFTKMLGPVLLAAIALACLAASPAMADEAIVLCKTNEEACKAVNYAGEGFTAAAAASFNFGELGAVKCASTMARSEATQITALSFSECGEGCSIKAEGLPFSSSLEGPSLGNGKIKISDGGGGEPKITATCGALECTYDDGSLEATYVGGKPATVAVSKSMALQTKSFFCAKAAVWSGSYQFTSRAYAVYMADRAIEGPVFCAVNKEICPQKLIINFSHAALQMATTFK